MALAVYLGRDPELRRERGGVGMAAGLPGDERWVVERGGAGAGGTADAGAGVEWAGEGDDVGGGEADVDGLAAVWALCGESSQTIFVHVKTF